MSGSLHFDRVAADYDAVRPGYPDAILSRALDGVAPTSHVLEFGCGTGQLTRSLVARGLTVHAIDQGAHLLARARANFVDHPTVRFEQADLRHWRPRRVYDVVASGNAFHWLPAADALGLAVDALRKGGRLVVLRHEHPRPVTGFHRRAQDVYRRVFPSGRPIDDDPSDDERIALVTSQFALEPRLGPVRVYREHWTQRYRRDAYLRLVRTYSDQGSLPPALWRELSGGLAEIIDDEYGGTVERPYLTVAWVAHRL